MKRFEPLKEGDILIMKKERAIAYGIEPEPLAKLVTIKIHNMKVAIGYKSKLYIYDDKGRAFRDTDFSGVIK